MTPEEMVVKALEGLTNEAGVRRLDATWEK